MGCDMNLNSENENDYICVSDVALIHYPSYTDSIKQVCNFHVILLWSMLPRDHLVSRLLYGLWYAFDIDSLSEQKLCELHHNFLLSILLCFSIVIVYCEI
jgi:hypothetical protein